MELGRSTAAHFPTLKGPSKASHFNCTLQQTQHSHVQRHHPPYMPLIMDSDDEISAAEMSELRKRLKRDNHVRHEVGRHAAFLRESRARFDNLKASRKTTKKQLLDLDAEREAHEAELFQNLAEMYGPTFTAAYPTEGSTSKAEQVFSTPELFELILALLNARDILVVQQVSKNICATIRDSGRIQRRLGLRPDPQANFHPTFSDSIWGFRELSLSCYAQYRRHTYMYMYPDGWPKHKPNELVIAVAFDGRPPQMDGLGSKCLSMLVCQPPVKELQPFVDCCNRAIPRMLGAPGPPDDWLPKPIRRETGITVGDVFEETAKLIEKHKMCPWASEWYHDKKRGTVKVSPSFQGIVQLRGDDPALKAQAKALDEANRSREEDEERRRKMRAYCQAKIAGESTFTLHWLDTCDRIQAFPANLSHRFVQRATRHLKVSFFLWDHVY
jgi:hypothetical protein